jgi:hypothetical protein
VDNLVERTGFVAPESTAPEIVIARRLGGKCRMKSKAKSYPNENLALKG